MGSKGSKGDKPDEGKKKVKVKKPNPKYYVKVLMVGTSSSGKSTLAKQMKIVHCDGFTSEERENYRRILISNLVLALKELITHAQQWRIELACSDVVALFEQMDTFDALTPELVDNIKTLWEDPGIKETYARRNEFDLPANTAYCVSRAAKLIDSEYHITDEDILHARQRTTGFVENEFQQGRYTWNLIDVGGQRAERRKWVHFYEGVTAVIYVAALDTWDVVLPEDPNTTRMEESLEVFESLVNHEWFQQTPWILFLNKKDIFEEKLRTTELSKTYPEYKGGSKYTNGVEFVKRKFLKRLKSRTPEDLYVHITCALDTQQVKFVFNSVMEWLFQKRVQVSGIT